MSGSCVVRTATPGDAAALSRLRYEFRSEHREPAEEEEPFLARCETWMAERLEGDPHWHCWVVEGDGQIVGNLWPGEAIDLAVQLKARVLLGTHNDLFAGNRVDPGMLFSELDRHAPWQRCHVLQPGELYLYAG